MVACFSYFISFRDRMLNDQHLSERGKSPSLKKHWWSSPQLWRKNRDTQDKKQRERRTSSQWTKIRHSLDFIRKSNEIQKYKKIHDDSQEDEKRKKSNSLTFLGQLYGDSFGDDGVFTLE